MQRLGVLVAVVDALLAGAEPPPPRVMSTTSIDGASRSIASASSGVMFGPLQQILEARRRTLRLTTENFATKIVSGPMPS